MSEYSCVLNSKAKRDCDICLGKGVVFSANGEDDVESNPCDYTQDEGENREDYSGSEIESMPRGLEDHINIITGSNE